MPIIFVRNDITKMTVDAIVNAANNELCGGGGVDGCIHKAAGPGLLKACQKLGGCATGDAKVTAAYDLPCKYVIHTVGPVWSGGSEDEETKLRSCYYHSLELAAKKRCKTVAFPLISAGVYGYPKDKALGVAVEEIAAFLRTHEMTVYVVLFDRDAFEVGKQRFIAVEQFIDDHYASVHSDQSRCLLQMRTFRAPGLDSNASYEDACETARSLAPCAPCAPIPTKKSLAKELDFEVDESFSEMLLRKIDERGMTDVQCYKKANIDRKLFSKIRSDVHYKPSKTTAFAFAVALELSLDETKELLRKAGFALSHSFKFDLIMEYCISRKIYNIHEINVMLFAFDQPLLGV